MLSDGGSERGEERKGERPPSSSIFTFKLHLPLPDVIDGCDGPLVCVFDLHITGRTLAPGAGRAVVALVRGGGGVGTGVLRHHHPVLRAERAAFLA